VLSFGVSSVPLFLALFIVCFSLNRVFQVFIKRSLKIMTFSKDFLKDSLCCDFLCCMCYFASLEEV
jgi:hypothetical protein